MLGENVVLREASDDVLHRSLLASAAIPIIFDPVVLPMVDGTDGGYVDGSIASNAVVEIARTVAKNIHVVLVDAPRRRTTYANAVAPMGDIPVVPRPCVSRPRLLVTAHQSGIARQ